MSGELVKEPRSADVSPVDRGREISGQISRAVRILRVKTPPKRLMYQFAGLKPRRRDKVFSVLFVLCFLLVFIVPTIASAIYYGLIASDQYESEARFVVRPATSAVSNGPSGGQNAVPEDKIVQDTQVVMNYINSPAVLEDIGDTLDLQQLYGRGDIDFLSRLDEDASREDLLDYWDDMVGTSVKIKSGIVTLTTLAYSPEEAQRVGQTVMKMAEQRINSLNSGIWSTLVGASSVELEEARKSLTETRLAIEELQNRVGVFDLELRAQQISDVILEVQGQLFELQAEEAILAKELSENAPQLQQVRDRIQLRENQIKDLRAELAGSSAPGSLTAFSREYDVLSVQQDIAEERLEEAVKDYERLRIISQLQLVYLDEFLSPTLPQDPSYPDRFLQTLAVTGIALLAWLISMALLRTLRNRMD
ncbi:MAG: hypothetical protein AAFY73_04295 [Pseudomonadota bacterium]